MNEQVERQGSGPGISGPSFDTDPVFVERPLRTLPREDASALIERLHSPQQRFDRAFHRYWRKVLGQSAEEARRSTDAELAQAAEDLLSNLDDPHVHTIGAELLGEYQPFGIFAFRDLEDHAQGRVLAQHLNRSQLDERFPGRLGICHAVALLDEHAGLKALKRVFLSIACKALAGNYSFVFFFSSDLRLARLYRRFGMKFPQDLCFPDSAHLVGVYDATSTENLERAARTSTEFGIDWRMLTP